MEKFAQMAKEGRTGSLATQDVQEASVDDGAVDEAMAKFKEVIGHSPSQVLRYRRKGAPLWISSEARLSAKDVPHCDNCGARRVFEFQLMPQLLLSLNLDPEGGEDGIDWGILAVYTCEDSCSSSDDKEYKTEYIYRQMPSAKSNL